MENDLCCGTEGPSAVAFTDFEVVARAVDEIGGLKVYIERLEKDVERLRTDRDAERGLADMLARALEDEAWDGDFWHELTDPALDAWRERRGRSVAR